MGVKRRLTAIGKRSNMDICLNTFWFTLFSQSGLMLFRGHKTWPNNRIGRNAGEERGAQPAVRQQVAPLQSSPKPRFAPGPVVGAEPGEHVASRLERSQAEGSHIHTQTRPHGLQGGRFGAPSRLRAVKGRGCRPEPPRTPSAQLLPGRRAARGRERGKGKASVSCLKCLE